MSAHDSLAEPGWLGALRQWPRTLADNLWSDAPVARVVLAGVRGSAPREAGACMLVDREGFVGSIGGGQLEWQALRAARALLAGTPAAPGCVERLVLGSDLEQCCGGVVELWIERYTSAQRGLLQSIDSAARGGAAVLVSRLTAAGIRRHVVRERGSGREVDELLGLPRWLATPRLMHRSEREWTLLERLDEGLPPVWLFGAGHVGQALVRICAELPLQLTWVDSRDGAFPAVTPHSVRTLYASSPQQALASAPAGAHFVVMTHSHPLDYTLCRAILARADFAWLGLIGSKSKAARFRARLARDGLGGELIERLSCPIGLSAITSKWPAAIAVGVAAQLLARISLIEAVRTDALAAAAADESRPAAAGCVSVACRGCGAVAG